MTLRSYIQISQKKGKKTKPRHHGIYLENYSNFKSKLSFNNGNIFEIHDCFRTGGNANDLSQLINSLSLPNQDFAGLDNFNRLENLLCIQGVARKLNWCS